ncbi:hypothetical protein O181_081243 [Austropuccinia psidii MF-1]|uniref:Uncharacterized protein n=1 Tax=Austropuccinia psidii MF-1 TaxID=1389203 RepID=A0A9Q3FPG9_9BASI|nr:hypothetical protein [Austropuccinia psidii MF-1]
MPSTRSGASYKPSSSFQKGHRRDYGRSQSDKEGQGSVKDFDNKNCPILKLMTLFYLQKELTPPQEASVDIYKASKKAYNNELQHKEYQILADLWKNCMNSYLTVRKLLGHPNTCKLLNGWHPLMEKKNMMLLTAEWRKNNPQPPKQVPRPAAIPMGKGSHKLKTRAKGRHQPQALQPGIQDSKDSAGCHGKGVSDGQNHDGITEEGGSQIKIPEMM